jgi:hypothetical protein
MTMVPTFLLAATLAGPLHAQTCSGGNAGGIDATGNQCNAPTDAGAYTAGVTPPSMRTAKMGGIQPVVAAAVPLVHSHKTSVPTTLPAIAAQPASRTARAATAPGAPVKSAKIETGSASPCSGGPYGGMDATGNQCGEAPEFAKSILVAQPGKR